MNQSLAVHTTASCFDVSELTALPRVDVLSFYAGAPADALDYYAAHARGIVIAGTGSGNYSSAWKNKIAELEPHGIPVVRASRIGHGIVSRDPHFEALRTAFPLIRRHRKRPGFCYPCPHGYKFRTTRSNKSSGNTNRNSVRPVCTAVHRQLMNLSNSALTVSLIFTFGSRIILPRATTIRT